MAGRFTIQRPPRGLLGWLSMKGSGDTPSELAPFVSGHLDLTQLYLQDKSFQVTSNTANISVDGGAGDTNGLTRCPAGTFWFVSAYTAQRSVALAAGTNFTVQLAVLRASATSWQPLLPDQRVVLATEKFALGCMFPFGALVMRPGDWLGIMALNGTYGTPFPCTLQVDGYALDW